MTADELHFLLLAIGAIVTFGVALAWAKWFSNRS